MRQASVPQPAALSGLGRARRENRAGAPRVRAAHDVEKAFLPPSARSVGGRRRAGRNLLQVAVALSADESLAGATLSEVLPPVRTPSRPQGKV